MALNFILDPFGFPMVELKKRNLFIHLLPVTRIQFERFISISGKGYGDSWYEAVESLNSRVSPAKIDSENYEGAFIGGITPSEAMDFIHSLGKSYDLPTVEEWQDAYVFLRKEGASVNDFSTIPAEGAAVKMLRNIAKLSGNLFDRTFMNNCMVEWVRQGRGYAGSGSPRPVFHENAYNPEVDIWNPFNVNKRMRHFGFRVVKRTEG